MMGDFNRNRKEMETLAENTNLILQRTPEEDNITWKSGNKESELDYILCNRQLGQSFTCDTELLTDHKMVRNQITLEPSKEKVKSTFITS